MADATGQSSNNITFNKKESLGEGGFGTVYRGNYGNTPAAVKRMLITDDLLNDALPYDNHLEHENVIRIYGKDKDNDFIYIAMELCAGTLEDLIAGSYEGPSPGTMSQVMLQVTLGLKYLHDNRIIHRDLNPRNILISLPGKDGSNTPPKMKVADFGLCKKFAHEEKSAAVSKSVIGTQGWRPAEYYPVGDKTKPEVVARRMQSYSSDIFSLGCIFGYSFTGGYHPFGNDRNFRSTNIIRGILDWKNENNIVDSSLKDLIKRMIDREREKRATMDQVLAHPTFVVAQHSLSCIKINNVLVAHYIWLENTVQKKETNTTVSTSVAGASSTLSIQEDSRGKIIQPVYRLLKWTQFEFPPQLEDFYSPHVTQIAHLLATVDQLIEDEAKKQNFRSQIIRRTLLFDVRMPKWLTRSEAVITQDVVKKALETLPETHRAAFTGDCEHLKAKNLENVSDDDRTKTWNRVFCWSGPSSSPDAPDAANSEETDWRLFIRSNDFTSDEIRAQTRMAEAWQQDRIPPAFYLAAANGQSEFCKRAIEAVRSSEQHKQKLKDFVIELFYYALYVANDESIALECLDYATEEFDQKEFFKNFPCVTFKHIIIVSTQLIQLLFPRLIMLGWYQFVTIVINKWLTTDRTRKMQLLKEAFSDALKNYATRSGTRKILFDNLSHVLYDALALETNVASVAGQSAAEQKLISSQLTSFDLVESIFTIYYNEAQVQAPLWRIGNRETDAACHDELKSFVSNKVDLLWSKKGETTMIRFFCGADPSIHDSYAIKRSYLTSLCFLTDDMIMNYIPTKLSYKGMCYFIEIMTKGTDDSGNNGCYLLFSKELSGNKQLFRKIVEKLLVAQQGHEKLDEFLFTPTQNTSCLIADVWRTSGNNNNYFFGVVLGQHKSERIERIRPLLTSLDSLRINGNFRTDIRNGNGNLTGWLQKLRTQCMGTNDNLGGQTKFLKRTRTDHDGIAAKQFARNRNFPYLIDVLEHLFKLVASCIENDKAEHFQELTRPIFEMIDESWNNGNVSNGLGTLFLFLFVKKIKATWMQPQQEDSKSEAVDIFRDFAMRSRAIFAENRLTPTDDQLRVKIVQKLKSNVRTAGNPEDVTLNQLITELDKIVLSDESPFSTELVAYAKSDSTASDFGEVVELLLLAAITNDWLKFTPNRRRSPSASLNSVEDSDANTEAPKPKKSRPQRR